LGQKHYNVPYELKRILLYLVLAGVLILVDSQIGYGGLHTSIPVHLLLCGGFIGLIYWLEKGGVKNEFSNLD
jgi:hypothetical protein